MVPLLLKTNWFEKYQVLGLGKRLLEIQCKNLRYGKCYYYSFINVTLIGFQFFLGAGMYKFSH